MINGQHIIVFGLVALSAVWLIYKLIKIIRKPRSACDSCLMKDHCPADCEELRKPSDKE